MWLVGVSVVPAGPVHSVLTLSGTPTDEGSSTVQVRESDDPAKISPGGVVTLTLVGAGTARKGVQHLHGGGVGEVFVSIDSTYIEQEPELSLLQSHCLTLNLTLQSEWHQLCR